MTAAGQQRDVVIIGASLAGLFAAAAAAASGSRTMIIERDVLPDSPVARKGVPQGRQPHVLLHRGLLAAEKLIPGIREDLLSHGAVPFDTGTMAWLGEYGWLPTWIPAYETVSATRPLFGTSGTQAGGRTRRRRTARGRTGHRAAARRRRLVRRL